MDVLIFYRDDCKRCKRIFDKIAKVRKLVPDGTHFLYYNTNNKLAYRVAKRYDVRRLPTIVVYGEKFFVGLPDDKDLFDMLNYLYNHPESADEDELSRSRK